MKKRYEWPARAVLLEPLQAAGEIRARQRRPL